MQKIICLIWVLAAATGAWSYSPDFISKYVENSKLLYADNGYEVVKEKTFDIGDLDRGNNKIAYVLEPGEYFVQLVTEPCFKINVEVRVPAQDEQYGIVSEKPEMRSAIAIFDIPQPSGKPAYLTEIQLNGVANDLCYNAKARLLVFKFVSE